MDDPVALRVAHMVHVVANLLEPPVIRDIFNASQPRCGQLLAEQSPAPAWQKGPYAVYVLLLGDHRHVYVGHYGLSGVWNRINDHQAGKGAKITREMGVMAVWGYVVVATKEEALATEKGFAQGLQDAGYPTSYGWYSFEAWKSRKLERCLLPPGECLRTHRHRPSGGYPRGYVVGLRDITRNAVPVTDPVPPMLPVPNTRFDWANPHHFGSVQGAAATS